jgi:hypothetical protein
LEKKQRRGTERKGENNTKTRRWEEGGGPENMEEGEKRNSTAEDTALL